MPIVNASAQIYICCPKIVDGPFGSDITGSLKAGDTVTWVSGQIRNAYSYAVTVSYSWTIDGTTVASGSQTCNPGYITTVYGNCSRSMTAGNHTISFNSGSGTTPTTFNVSAPVTPPVTFEAQGGTTPTPATKTVTYGSTYGALATTSRTGYNFGGWWTGTGGTGTQITSATTVNITAGQTLFAKWTAANTTHGTPYSWLDQYGLVTAGNYEAADLADTDRDGFAAWQEYVAGTIPTNSASVFQCFVTVSNSRPQVRWTPDLGAARLYSIDGRTNLTAGAWGTTNATSRFFRVKVSLP